MNYNKAISYFPDLSPLCIDYIFLSSSWWDTMQFSYYKVDALCMDFDLPKLVAIGFAGLWPAMYVKNNVLESGCF